MRSTQMLIAAAVIAGLQATLFVGSVAAAEKTPPACAAVTFRPVPSGLADGEQNAGRYKSRFGRIDVVATVKSGEAQSYFVEVNGKPPAAVAGALPPSVEACAKAKRMGAIGTPPDHCIGDKLAVLIDHSGDKRYVLLYAHRSGEWRFCSAGAT
jgi:hypothetical protein